MKYRIFDNKQFVGYVNQVTPGFIKVHFPSSILLNKYYQDGKGLHSGILGNYVLIEGEDNGFLAKVNEIILPEKERINLTQDAFQSKDFHPTGKLELLVCFDYCTHICKKGLTQFPPVGSKVYSCSDDFLCRLLKNFGRSNSEKEDSFIELANLPNNKEAVINVSAQSLFSRHLAIVGSTGGGKSWSVARIIEEIIKKNGKSILIDATGEYKTLAKNFSEKVLHVQFNSGVNNTCLHYTNLRETDLIAMFRPSGQAQLPKLQDAMKSLRLVTIIDEKTEKTSNDNTIVGFYEKHKELDYSILNKAGNPRKFFLGAYKENPLAFSPLCKFNINALPRQVLKECVSEFANNGNFGSINPTIEGHCQTLISRILLTLNNDDFKSIFGFSEVNDQGDLITTIEDFLENDTKNILIIDTHKVPSDNSARDILVNAVGRFLLEKAVNDSFKESPLILILDEAHQFLNKKVRDEFSVEVELNAYERIAKECRKFGLFLTLATQMPRDIPAGVLSQMGAFIVHRIINQKDREAIEYACSDANRNALSFLPILSSGEALLTGVDFPMPIVLQIVAPECKPDSETPFVFKKKEKEKVH
jgi:uncharacterized protein